MQEIHDDAIFDDEPNENYVGCPKMQEIHDKLKAFKVRFGKSWKHLDLAKDFCQTLLTFDVNARPTAEEALKHPFMAKFVEKRKSVLSRQASRSRSPSPA